MIDVCMLRTYVVRQRSREGKTVGVWRSERSINNVTPTPTPTPTLNQNPDPKSHLLKQSRAEDEEHSCQKKPQVLLTSPLTLRFSALLSSSLLSPPLL